MSIRYNHQLTFSSYFLQDTIDPKHKLVKLTSKMDWEKIYDSLAPYYSTVGRQALPIQLMVGLHLLKHMNDMSDEQCSDRVRGDIYWMYFCGVDTEDLKGKYKHLDSSSMTKFRNRIGGKGFSEIEKIIQSYLIKKNKIDSKVMNIDSSCMEKNIEYPTDSSLLDKGRKKLLKSIKTLEILGIKSIQSLRSYSRASKRQILLIVKLGKDRADRIKKATLQLARHAKHVVRKGEKMIRRAQYAIRIRLKQNKDVRKLKKEVLKLKECKDIVKKIILQAQQRFKGKHIPKKIYSLHEPQAVVIRKGKRSKKNEYGSKINISTDRNGYIVNHELYHDNRHDSKLLDPALKQWQQKTGRLPKQVNGDRGYVQKKKNLRYGLKAKVKKLCIPTTGKIKHPDHDKKWFKQGQRWRAQIEGVFGHLKQDHRMDRCRYKGSIGDEVNLVLAALSWNLTKLARDPTR